MIIMFNVYTFMYVLDTMYMCIHFMVLRCGLGLTLVMLRFSLIYGITEGSYFVLK